MSAPDNEFLLVPHNISNERIPPTAASMHRPAVVTDMWIERNLHRKRYISPEANITNTPFPRFPIPGFDRLVVCSTGFEDVDLLHMSKAVKLMGATYDEEFSPKASLLVCNKVVPGHEKFRHAQHWNVPAATADWLWDCIRIGELKDFQPYLVQPWTPKTLPESDEAQKHPMDEASSKKKREAAMSKVEGFDQTNVSSNHGTCSIEHRTLDTADTGKTLPDDPTMKSSIRTHCLPIPDSSKTIPPPTISTSDALREISPNSSPPKLSTSPSKAPHASDSPAQHPCQDPALSSAISALLAHHQNVRSSKPDNMTTLQPRARPPVRRKRQLFGRAPSNTSNLSRASSVDAAQTDGVGIPVELTHTTSNISTNNNNNDAIHPNRRPSITATDSILFDAWADEQAAAHEENQEQQLQMTQLG
ncbi:MAG: hypothetical protein Q9196_005129, partial [Gyalolechia fulgens]